MLSNENKAKAKLIAQGVSVIKVAKQFNVSHQSIYKLMKLNKEFANLIDKEKRKMFWEQNEEQIKKICKFVHNKFYKKIQFDELINISYLEVLDNKTFEFDLDYLLYRLKYLCRKELKQYEQYILNENIDIK
jgi:transposase